MKKLLAGLGLAAFAALLIACGSPSPNSGKPISAPAASHSAAAQYSAPVAADFTITGKVTSQQCFGSAGCNVQVDPELVYVGHGAEPGSSWDITFQALGDESGPITQTLTLTFDATGQHGTYGGNEIFASTKKHADVPLTFQITGVEKSYA